MNETKLKFVINTVKSRRRRVFVKNSFNVLLKFSSLFLILATGSSLLFSFFPLLIFIYIFDVAFLISFFGFLFLVLKNSIFRKQTLVKVAKEWERKIDKPNLYISTALELSVDETLSKSNLTLEVYKSAAQNIENYNNIKSSSSSFLVWKILAPTLIVLFMVINQIVNPKLSDWILFPLTKTSGVINVTPGDITIGTGDSVTLTCRIDDVAYPSISVNINNIDGNENSFKKQLLPDSVGLYKYQTGKLTKTIEYTFLFAGKIYKTFRVTVLPRPKLFSLKATIYPPQYIGKKPYLLSEGEGEIIAPVGSRVKFEVGVKTALKNCLFISGKDTVDIPIKDGIARGSVGLFYSRSYYFSLEDSLLQKSDTLPKYFITVISDEKPLVKIICPGMDVALDVAQQETLFVEGYDDYGFSKLDLLWYRSGTLDDSIYKKNIKISDTKNSSISLNIPWDITKLSLYPGDSIYYWIYAKDTKPYGEINFAISDTFSFRIPTFAEIHKIIAERENYAEVALSNAENRQKKIKNSIEKLLKATSKKNSLSHEDKKIIKDLKDEMQAQKDSLNSAIQAMKDAVEKLNKNGVNREITEKMDRLQKELEKLLEEFGDSLLFNNNKNREDLSMSELRKSLEKMAKMLPELSERLDKTIEYLKAFKRESERAMLAKQAERLAGEQQEIANNLTSEELKKQEKNLNSRIKDFLKDTKKSLVKESSPVSEKDFPSMKDVESNSKKIDSEISENSSPSQSTMTQMAASLSSMSSQMESSLSSSMQKKMEEDRALLIEMAENNSMLSEWQKSLLDNSDFESNENLAMNQQAIKKSLDESLKQLDKLSALNPSAISQLYGDMNKSKLEMKKVLKNLYSPMGKTFIKSAKSSLNRLTANLLSQASGMEQQGGSGGGSMMGGLKKLSGQQAAINSATASLLRDMLGSGKSESSGQGQGENGTQKNGQGKNSGGMGEDSPEQQAARKAVAKAQSEISEKLKKLAEKYGNSGNEQLKNRVKEMEQEAKKIAQLLQNPNESVEERQNIFLKRMLESTISINRKDEEKDERQSQRSESIYNSKKINTENLDINKTDQFYKMRINAINQKYPISYRQKVSSYFDKLSRHLFNK